MSIFEPWFFLTGDLSPQMGTQGLCPLLLRTKLYLCTFFPFLGDSGHFSVLVFPFWARNGCLVWIPMRCLLCDQTTPHNLSQLIQTWIIPLFNCWSTGQISFSKGLVKDGVFLSFFTNPGVEQRELFQTQVFIYSAHNALHLLFFHLFFSSQREQGLSQIADPVHREHLFTKSCLKIYLLLPLWNFFKGRTRGLKFCVLLSLHHQWPQLIHSTATRRISPQTHFSAVKPGPSGCKRKQIFI